MKAVQPIMDPSPMIGSPSPTSVRAQVPSSVLTATQCSVMPPTDSVECATVPASNEAACTTVVIFVGT